MERLYHCVCQGIVAPGRPDERRELIRLAIKHITYSGLKEPVVFAFL